MSKEEFFKRMDELGLSLTYGDVRLKTGYSEVMPIDVSTQSKFSRNVTLNVPIVSAAMDTVTEYKMAIEIAKLGGLGIIHRNLSKEKQGDEVDLVKFHLNALIEKPICVYEDEKIKDILKRKEEKNYTFHSFPVLNRNEKLVGLLTRTEFIFNKNLDVLVRDIMTKELVTVTKGTSIEEAYKIMLREKKKVLPLIDNDNKISGLYLFKDIERIKSGQSDMNNVDSRGQLRVGAAIGTGFEAVERVDRLYNKNVDVIVIDTAHGDTASVIETLKKIKSSYKVDVVVGNISEPESAKRLIEAGADGIKVGQGPGSICTTRIIAGIGCPQLSAIYNCAKIGDEYGIPICADGGIRYSGDIPVAIGAGASSVMIGSLLAGTDEAPGDIIFFQGRRWKSYRGMGSIGAMGESMASRERYSQEETAKDKVIPEGVEGLVPYKGPLKDVMNQLIGGLKRGMGYVGAKNIQELRKKADFRRHTVAGKQESHPHDVYITREPPNYPLEKENVE